MKEFIKNFSEFIRLKVCIFATAIGISGYLMFNPLNMSLIFVSLTSFFGCAGAYSLNNMKDKEEDLINRQKANPFVFNNKSLLIVFACFLLGIIFSFFLFLYSIFFSLLGVIISLNYSLFRLKKYLLIKNLYTGLGANIVFLIGAGNINIEIICYYILVSFFILIISMISDLRDYSGDKFSQVKTLATSLGYDISKRIVFLLLGILSILILFFSNLFILLPFIMVTCYFLYKDNFSLAHSYGGCSFVFLALWLVI
jgi:4-hydroxybenzoate polyprenyltransferase